MTHSECEDVRELVRRGMQTPLFERSMRLRRRVERLFAGAEGDPAMLAMLLEVQLPVIGFHFRSPGTDVIAALR